MRYKVFTLEEATACIPVLQPLVRTIIAKKAAMASMHDQLLTLDLLDDHRQTNYATDEGKEYVQEAAALENLIVSFEEDIKRVADLGCILRDMEQGIVDFYHVDDQVLCFLTWRVTETAITCGHTLDTSHHTTVPLQELKGMGSA